VALSVESSIIPIVDVIFEHRVYLPSAGAFTALVCGAFLLVSKLGHGKPRTAAIALLAFLPVLCAGAAFKRNYVWRNSYSLWSDVVNKSPGKARARYNLGLAYHDRGQMRLAASEWELSVEIEPRSNPALKELGIMCASAHRYEEAKDYYRRAIEASATDAAAHYNLAVLLEKEGHAAEAVEYFQSFLRIAPAYLYQYVQSARLRIKALRPAYQGDARAHFNLGNAYKDRGDLESAAKEWKLAIEIDPKHSFALSQLGTKHFLEGQHEEAIDYYRRAIEASETNAEAHYNLAMVLEKSGRPAEAAVCYGNFIRVAPPDLHREVKRARRRIEALKPPDR
jgi:tetratricopeptide (TPR) repeat protein